jgi:hypothetical protein
MTPASLLHFAEALSDVLSSSSPSQVGERLAANFPPLAGPSCRLIRLRE